jgi:hypothetical protein
MTHANWSLGLSPCVLHGLRVTDQWQVTGTSDNCDKDSVYTINNLEHKGRMAEGGYSFEYILCIDSFRYEIQEQKKFRYGIPAHFEH